MGFLSVVACLMAIVFLSYSGYVLYRVRPKRKKVSKSFKIFCMLSVVFSVVSVVFAILYFVKDELQYALPLSCYAMAFAFPVMVLTELIKIKNTKEENK